MTGSVQRLLHVISCASVPVRSPIDVDLMGDRMPSDLVLMVLESNVAVSVVAA